MYWANLLYIGLMGYYISITGRISSWPCISLSSPRLRLSYFRENLLAILHRQGQRHPDEVSSGRDIRPGHVGMLRESSLDLFLYRENLLVALYVFLGLPYADRISSYPFFAFLMPRESPRTLYRPLLVFLMLGKSPQRSLTLGFSYAGKISSCRVKNP